MGKINIVTAAWLLILLQTAAYGVHVSVYYYPWYNGIDDGDVLRYELVPPQPPVMGDYSSDDNDVISQHLKWSEDYCIDNWICSWWGPGHKTDNNTKDRIAPQLNGSKVTYCLFYETTGRIGMGSVSSGDVDRMRSDVDYMASNHFDNPSYYKIDGRPVLYIYLTRTLTDSYAAGYQAMRDAASAQGHDLYIVGDENYWGAINEDRLRCLDATSAYNMHRAGYYEGFPSETGLLESIKTQYLKDKQIADSLGVKFIPNFGPGFNDRPVRLDADHHPIPRRIHPDSNHTSTFRHYLDVALETMDQDLQVITINSWNEWMEDSNIEPVERTGTTSKDSNDDKYTLGYEYTGYGEDYLVAIRDLAVTNIKTVPEKTQKPSIAYYRPNSTIRIYLPEPGNITLQVFDLKGRTLATLLNGYQNAGIQRIRWHKNNYTVGMFFIRLSFNKSAFINKILLLK